MQDRILRPFVLQPFHGQSSEKLFLTLEISFQGRNQQTFPEPAGTAQEIIFATLHQSVDQGRLVHIDVIPLTEFLKALYAYRVFSHLYNIKTRQYKYTQSQTY